MIGKNVPKNVFKTSASLVKQRKGKITLRTEALGMTSLEEAPVFVYQWLLHLSHINHLTHNLAHLVVT